MIGKTISHYEILEKLGAGGMGTVYKAQDTNLDRFVALKFLPPHLSRDEENKERFIHEAKAASALDHPNICTIYEIDQTEDGQMFIAMAYYEGETLKDKIERGPLPVDDAVHIVIQIAEGLAKAHAKGIIHRDIKPANILVTEDGVVKIVDFGLAKLAGRTMLTKEGTTLGTVAYMSPEQAQGAEVNHRTDIWALGVVLYEMLTGEPPFKGDYEQAVIYSIMNENPEGLTALRTAVPMELEQIVDKCLEKQPSDRYQQVNELLVDLKRVQGKLKSGKTIAKKAAPKEVRRKPAKIYGALIVLLLLVLASFYLFDNRSEKIESLAVLPLTNIMGNPEQEYFVDGMTEALITELSKINALRVISRTSVMQYKNTNKSLTEIADDLGVDAVVEGSVLRREDRVRITVQLVKADPERHLWAEAYDRELRDIFQISSEVTKSVVREIKATLTPREQARLTTTRTVNPEAHEAYLRGRYHWNKRTPEGIKKAIDYFQQAISVDSNFALGYAGLSDAYNILTDYAILPSADGFPIAKEYALKALRIDEGIAEARISLADIKYEFDRNWTESEREFQRAIAMNPSYASGHQWYAWLLFLQGRFDEAREQIQQALSLDPLSVVINRDIGTVELFARNYDQAIQAFQNAIEMDYDFPFVHLYLGMAYVYAMRYEEGLREIQIEKDNRKTYHPFVESQLGVAYVMLGKRSEAERILEDLIEQSKDKYIPATQIAIVCFNIGETEGGFEWLEKAVADRDEYLGYLKVDPSFDVARSDPRFRAILKRIGLQK